jgi:redox-sensitive bicupin YhaK (pirin superfamily)
MTIQSMPTENTPQQRRIVHRTRGNTHGPITRLMSPGDLGELLKPFVFLDYFDFSGFGASGLPVHPHSGLATHTTIMEGSVLYADSTGKSGTLRAHGIEWMQAGGGVWHGGGPGPHDGALRGYQLWVALAPPLELAPAYSQYVDAASVPSDGHTRLLLGTYRGLRSAIPDPAPITFLQVKLRDGERWTYEPSRDHDVAWLAIATGGLRVGNTSLHREMAVFEEGNAAINVVADGDVELVVGSAVKHPHPLVTGDYSVHTSRETLRLGESGIEKVASTMQLRPFKPIPAP